MYWRCVACISWKVTDENGCFHLCLVAHVDLVNFGYGFTSWFCVSFDINVRLFVFAVFFLLISCTPLFSICQLGSPLSYFASAHFMWNYLFLGFVMSTFWHWRGNSCWFSDELSCLILLQKIGLSWHFFCQSLGIFTCYLMPTTVFSC